MTDNPAISVIVPVYNAGRYLERCIDSILSQTFLELELILIDDGSTDSSGAICDSFAAKDPRVIVKHCKNHGVSAARNEGITIARGQFISFVDADDFLDLSAYGKLYATAVQTAAQVVWCDCIQLFKGGRTFHIRAFEEGPDKRSSVANMVMYGPNGGTLWNYLLIDNRLIKEHSLRFPSRYGIGEDFWFGLKVHVFAKKSTKVKEPLYLYNMENMQSLSHREGAEITFKKWDCLCESYDFLKEQNLFKIYEKEISWRMLLAKTPWVMSPSTFKYYFSNLPEVNEFVDDNPLLGKKMIMIMRLLNNRRLLLAGILAIAYSLKNKLS